MYVSSALVVGIFGHLVWNVFVLLSKQRFEAFLQSHLERAGIQNSESKQAESIYSHLAP